jgi:hypothetical protein
MDLDRGLTEEEKRFLIRAAKRRNLFLLSSIASVLVAVLFLAYHALIAKDLNGLRFAVIIILLLSGRSYLRLYKSAVIFNKLHHGSVMKHPGRD